MGVPALDPGSRTLFRDILDTAARLRAERQAESFVLRLLVRDIENQRMRRRAAVHDAQIDTPGKPGRPAKT